MTDESETIVHLFKGILRSAAIVVLLGVFLLAGRQAAFAQPAQARATCKTYAACVSAGVKAYVYGYPLVMMGLTERLTTNVPNANTVAGRAPINQFAHETSIPDASYKDVVLPNVNTLYSLAWLDLTQGPVILEIPNIQRFFLFEVVDAWTNVDPHSPGTRSGTRGGKFAFVGPAWNGSLPPDITKVYKMSTNTVWLIARTYTNGSAEDIHNIVNNLQPKYTLTPLVKRNAKGGPPVDPNLDQSPPYQQIDRMDAGTFFGMLADQMMTNPPLPADGPRLAVLAKIGLVPGKPFDINTLDPTTRSALEEANKLGNELVTFAATNPPEKPVNGWLMSLTLGDFGTEYLLRAATARNGVGANYFKDAVYAGIGQDNQDQDLTGDHQYTITFEKGKLPPSNRRAFWSVTLYNATVENLADNPINRYALGIPSVLDHLPCLNDDGSLTLYIQHDAPSQGPNSKEYCNWLPSPNGHFILVMRIYWPGEKLFNHKWIPPAVVRVQ